MQTMEGFMSQAEEVAVLGAARLIVEGAVLAASAVVALGAASGDN